MGLSVSGHYLNVAVTGIQFGVYEEYALDDFPVGFLAVGENDKLIETRRSFPLYTLRTRTHTDILHCWPSIKPHYAIDSTLCQPIPIIFGRSTADSKLSNDSLFSQIT